MTPLLNGTHVTPTRGMGYGAGGPENTFIYAFGGKYVDDLNARNLSGTMAWSGDVLYYKIWAGKPYEFIMPEGGALLWIDNMLIPAHSANPAGALELMDFYYAPENAQLLTEYILYMSPVPEVQKLIVGREVLATREGGGPSA